VDLVQRQNNVLHLSTGAPAPQNADLLVLSTADLLEAESRISNWISSPPKADWRAPKTVPLLRNLLLLASENSRLRGVPVQEDLEFQVDQLHRALSQQVASEEARLRAQKLSSLAEFAAGAGHEINNPLAVISGQAQYLLHHELDQARRSSLETIVSQARRIHLILNELMHFARPPRPKPEPVDVAALLQTVTDAFVEIAASARVQIVCLPPEHLVLCKVDPQQIKAALSCLLRNAIEAAAPDGWAKISVEGRNPPRLDIIVEDSGRGPPAAQREHLFDPFYSGHQAGRGRGLGLPTAWRLARENGGDVFFEDLPDGPARFVLSIPMEPHTTVRDSFTGANDQVAGANESRNGKNGMSEPNHQPPDLHAPESPHLNA
jgi:signal transduction histidine kinase